MFIEFWSISSGNGKELSSPSDIEVSKNFASSGLGSHSSSSQNSLCDNFKKYVEQKNTCMFVLKTKKIYFGNEKRAKLKLNVFCRPLRPTTLELGNCGVGGCTTATPPPVPPRWSRSALLTPLSQPSSVQSTPSEVQSTFSEKSGRPGRKKKRKSGDKAESVHYKDTEILDLFKGVSIVGGQLLIAFL